MQDAFPPLRSRATPITKREDSVPPEGWHPSSGRISATNRCNLHFCAVCPTWHSPRSQDTKQDRQEGNNSPWERKDQPVCLDLERKDVKVYLSLSSGHGRQIQNWLWSECSSWLVSAGLTRIPSAGSVTSWGLENVASLATEIQQGFPLILLLVSLRLWKGATGSSYRRIPWSPVDPGRAQGGGARGVLLWGWI